MPLKYIVVSALAHGNLSFSQMNGELAAQQLTLRAWLTAISTLQRKPVGSSWIEGHGTCRPKFGIFQLAATAVASANTFKGQPHERKRPAPACLPGRTALRIETEQ
jgi:hypothetical protein